MKNLYAYATSAVATAALIVTMTPATAQAAEASPAPKSGIARLWLKDPAKYGQPLSPEKCFPNKTCAQDFENATITWNKRNGVQVLNGAENATTFRAAGGAEVFGGFEGDAWNHAYCGPSVTTYNGQTRSLIVLAGEHAGASLDLNSPEAEQWKAERVQTGNCFYKEETPEPANPIIPITPDNPKDPAKSDVENASITIDALVASTTDFQPTAPVSAVTHRSGVYYSQDFGNNISVLYSAEQNKAIWMNTNAVAEYLLAPQEYGPYLWQTLVSNEDGQLTLQALVMQHAQFSYNWDDYGFMLYALPENQVLLSRPLSLEWQGEDYLIYHDELPALVNGFPDDVAGRVYDENLPVDTTFDWSSARYIGLPGVLVTKDADGNDWYIKATSEQKPLPGAVPVKSNMLLDSYVLSDRPRFASYGEWAYGGDYKMYGPMAMLGAPVGDEVHGTDPEGDPIVTQEFEGGTATWYKGTEWLGADLNERGLAKTEWYKSLNLR